MGDSSKICNFVVNGQETNRKTSTMMSSFNRIGTAWACVDSSPSARA